MANFECTGLFSKTTKLRFQWAALWKFFKTQQIKIIDIFNMILWARSVIVYQKLNVRHPIIIKLKTFLDEL